MNGSNAYYAAEMYRLWKQDPNSVHTSWQVYFSGLDKGMKSEDAFRPPPGLVSLPAAADGAPQLNLQGSGDLQDHMKVSGGNPFSFFPFSFPLLCSRGHVRCGISVVMVETATVVFSPLGSPLSCHGVFNRLNTFLSSLCI